MRILSGIDRISELSGLGTALLIVPAITIISFEVLMRYAFNAPTNWAHSVTTALAAVTYMLGGAHALQRGDFIRVTYIYDKLAPRTKGVVAIISHVLVLYWGIILAYGSFLQARRAVWSFRGGEWRPETTGTGWDVPIPALTKSVLFLGAVLVSLQAVVMLARAIGGRVAPEDPLPSAAPDHQIREAEGGSP